MATIMGFLMVSWLIMMLYQKLMCSSDFYENVNRYHSSAAKAVVSHHVDHAGAGQVTTTMVVSFPLLL